MRLVECVPNFSEGRDRKVIDAIAEAIASVDGVELLDVDPGRATNRTVMTFVGDPDSALEAAFRAIARAAELIDMRRHKGEHPRIGATDVCPFVPVSGLTMADCAELAGRLGARVGSELGIPVYLYGEAARQADRYNLADIRQGEYEGLEERMSSPSFRPDFGPQAFNAAAGATVIGARKFLIAYNVNLNTRSKQLANEIALTMREAGRAQRDSNGAVVRGADGKPVMVAGTLKAVKAVGWYIDEYRRAQVSINLVDYDETSIHHAFDEACRIASDLGVRVTGSEIVGLVPLAPMLAAGRHYLARQGRSQGVPDGDLIEVAAQSLGLSEIQPFDASSKIIEYRVGAGAGRLAGMSVMSFADEVSRESPAPGGGSVAALLGALSASLSAMVANLTHAKKGFAESRPLMNDLAVQAQSLKDELLRAVSEDTEAFNAIVEARRLPRDGDAVARQAKIQAAAKQAVLVPLQVMAASLRALELAETLAEKGNPNSLSDAGVAGLSARAALEGAYYNVLINLPGLDDRQYAESARQEAEALSAQARARADSLHQRMVASLSVLQT